MFDAAVRRFEVTFPDWRSKLVFSVAATTVLLLAFCALSALSSTFLLCDFKPPTPFIGQPSNGSIISEVFVNLTPLDLKQPWFYLLSGKIREAQSLTPKAASFNLAVLAALTALTGTLLVVTKRRDARLAFLVMASALSIFWSLRISAGWDEYFINLKHAFNLAHHFTFSANLQTNLEATVDFAPFALAAIVAKVLAVDVADAGLAVSLAGNVLCICVAYALSRKLSRGAEAPGVIAGALAGVFPAVINVGGTGFMSALFAGLVLLAAFWFIGLRGRWSTRAIALLGLLTLFRTEAVLFAVIVVAALGARFWLHAVSTHARPPMMLRGLRILAVQAIIVLGPFLLSAIIRKFVFGEPVPVPVVFKSAGADINYIRAGIQYILNCLHIFRFDILFVVAGVPIMLYVIKLGSRALVFFGCLLVFTLAYAAGGGDWFPPHWARYIAPLLLFILVLSIAVADAGARFILPRWRLPVFFAFTLGGVILLIGVGPTSNAYRDAWTDWPKSLNRWERVDRLSAYGDLLRRTLPNNAVVASPEDASLMYHAERDMIDLLGIANRTIAHSPLDPLGPGDLMHRRRNINVLKASQPDILALFEMSFRLGDDFKIDDPKAVQAFVQMFPLSQMQLDISFYRVGSYAYLQSLGYRPIAVLQPGWLFFYWVHDKAYTQHTAMLAKAGFAPRASIPLTYQYSKSITDRFFGGLPYTAMVVDEMPPPDSITIKPITITLGSTWAKEALPRPYVAQTPPEVGAAFASWNGSDANIGTITFGPFSVQKAALLLIVPVLRGPDGAGQWITLRDAKSGNVLTHQLLNLPMEHRWYWLSIRLNMPNSGLVTLESSDDGSGWGQWSAVGSPRFVVQKDAL